MTTFVNTWVARLRTAHPDHHAISRGIVAVAAFVFFGKLASAAKEMAVAYRYGVSADVDAYLFVLNLVNWPVAIWFSVITVVLVPQAARIRQKAPAELPRFRAELLGLTVFLGLTLTLLAWIGLPPLIRASWTGLTNRTAATAIEMVPALGLLAMFGVLISLSSAWMLVAGRHANTLMEGITALVILSALLVSPAHGAEPLVWGTLVGFALHLAGLVIALAREGEIEAPRLSRHSLYWPSFWQGFGIMLAGQTLTGFANIVDPFFAARLGEGAISALSYANRVLAMILGIGAMAVSRATLPVFSQMQAQSGDHLRRVAGHWVRLLFGFGLVVTVAAEWLSPWAVKLLFQRGAFTLQNTAVVTEVLRYGLTQLPFYFAGTVLVSLLASQGRYRTIAAVASMNLIVKVMANASLVPWLGIKGIALANALMYMASATLCWLAVGDTKWSGVRE